MLTNYGIGGNEVKLDADEAISAIPQNRTLIAQKLTIDTPVKPELVEGITSIEKAFEHFKPEVKVNFENAEGATKTEALKFKNLGDFGVKGITSSKHFLIRLRNRERPVPKNYSPVENE